MHIPGTIWPPFLAHIPRLAARGLPRVVDAGGTWRPEQERLEKQRGSTRSHTGCSASRGQNAELDPNPNCVCSLRTAIRKIIMLKTKANMRLLLNALKYFYPSSIGTLFYLTTVTVHILLSTHLAYETLTCSEQHVDEM